MRQVCSAVLAVLLILIIPLTLSAQNLVVPDEYLISSYGITRKHILRKHDLTKIKQINSRVSLVRKNKGSLVSTNLRNSNTDNYCAKLLKTGAYRICEPNYIVSTAMVPNDPNVSDQYALGASGTNTLKAWDITQGADDIIIAVLDTGIDYNHPDLKNNIWQNPEEIPENGIDDDLNGYIDDIHGISAITGSGNPFDDHNHGTHVAGIIAAEGNNNLGVSGVAWNAKLIGVKFITSANKGTIADAIEGMNYIINLRKKGYNIRVINHSWGGPGYSQILFDVFKEAESLGITNVIAAGNNGYLNNDIIPTYPGNFVSDGFTTIAALDKDFNLASFSHHGLHSVHIGAPGVNILSTFPNNSYASISGTSMATPYVSGAIALLLSDHPELTPAQTIQRLYLSGLDTPALVGKTYTARRLDTDRLIRDVRVPYSIPTGNATGCNYKIGELSYSPDYSADTTEILLQGDENKYATIELPFEFPFYNEKVAKIFISVNGVIYFKSIPAGLDFNNTETAPVNSIAALHSDLYMSEASQGVRVYKDDSKVVIYWEGLHYRNRTGSVPLKIRTVLNRDGSVQSFTEVNDQVTLDLLRAKSTIGINGSAIKSDATYAYNRGDLQAKTALGYNLSCKKITDTEDDKPIVSSMTIYTIDDKATAQNYAEPSNYLNLELLGTGDGDFTLNFELDQKSCPQSFKFKLKKKRAYISTYLRKTFNKFKMIKFKVGSLEKSVNIIRSKDSRKRNHSLACKQLYRQLEQG